MERMRIVFTDRKTKKVFDSDKELNKKYGPILAKRIKQRMAELVAAESLQMVPHLPPPRCHELEGNGHRFSVDVSPNMRLIFSAYGGFVIREDYGLDLSSVKVICVEEVRDTHDGKVRR